MSVTSCRLRREFGQADLHYRYTEESVTEEYILQLSAQSSNWPTILTQAQALGGSNNAPPARGALWPTNTGYGLYAKRFSFRVDPESTTQVYLTVTYLPAEPGEDDPSADPDDPLLWPVRHDLQYMEEEYIIEEARNVEEFTAPGFTRAAGTLGPLTNSVADEIEQQRVDIERIAVIKITKNVSNLSVIMDTNRQFARTTNSDEFTLGDTYNVPVRTLKFLGAESGGEQESNGVVYYPMTTSIGVYKTTDVALDNVGWNAISPFDNKKIRLHEKDEEGNLAPIANPAFLKLDGTKSDTAVKVTYRHLEPVAYATLLTTGKP